MSDQHAGAFESAQDAGPPPKGIVARWLVELRLADKDEATWREQATDALKRYRGADRAKNQPGFNILYSNVETMAPALYNSTPKPDVRRRFRDADPIGKFVSDVLERCLAFSMDDDDIDNTMQSLILDMLLTGRGVARVRYVPTFAGSESESDTESVAWEQAPIEIVAWDDFRRGPGRSWPEVRWVAFRHKLTRDELKAKFPGIGETLPLEDADIGENVPEDCPQDAFKRATLWEIWDRDARSVIWISPAYSDGPVKVDADPLGLVEFFPIPRPVLTVADSTSIVPIVPFSLYKSQADELDRITLRIQRILGAIKARGIYDSTLGELSELFKGTDNELIPAQNAIALAERGGLDKFIWMMPVETLVNVCRELIAQRESLKQTIYEITGLSDILRGASNANETATAQRIKGQWGSLRLQRLQREVQRFLRDLLRIKAEIIAERFSPDTLMTMTGIQLPTAQQKQVMMMQGQQVPVPSWDEVISVMRDDALRSFRIDIETDTTIMEQLAEDQQAMAAGIQSVTGFLTAVAPAVTSGAFPVEAAKAIVMAWARRSKMGREVEDALDQIKAPEPPPQDNSEQVKAQAEQARMQHEAQVEQVRMQHEAAMEQARSELERIKLQVQAQAQTEQSALERERMQAELAIKQVELQIKEAELRLKEIEISQQGEIERARIEAETQRASLEAARPQEARESGQPITINIPRAGRRRVRTMRGADGNLMAELEDVEDGE